MTLRICLWSGPRNVSTALMYSFAQRPDTAVVDEPFYAHFLATTPARHYHPGAEEVLQTMNSDIHAVLREVIFAPYPGKTVVFFKQMTHHLVNMDWGFLADTVNVLLTRDPREMLPSYAKNIELPTMADVGYAQHWELLDYLQGLGQNTAVLDSRAILENPRGVLSQLCDHLGIPFDERMLSWPAGARPEDGSWAKYWYASVHNSTGFHPYRPKTDPFPPHLEPLLAECQPYYDALAAQAMRGK
jgi:hypothetical protein